MMNLLRTALAVCATAATLAAQVPAKDRMVVVISLDGFPAYALDDPKLPVPALRGLIRNGLTARMTTVNPTVTWPNHTTMVTGVRADEHGLLFNGTAVRTGGWPPVKVDPMIDRSRMVHVPTVYDAAHQAGLTTAHVDWVAINRALGITWEFREWASVDGPLEQEMIRKGALTAEEVTEFTRANILFRDQVWTRAATYLIREHRPNLLLLHLLTLDTVHHRFGPRTLAAMAAMAFLDSSVEKVLEAIRAAGIEERTTVMVVADHGFKAYTREIRPAVALQQAGLAQAAHVIPEGGSALIYLDKARTGELLPQARKALDGVEGIDRVFGKEGFATLGLPDPARDEQMADLFLTAKPGYSFSGSTGGPVTAAAPQNGGSHGYVASDPDMDALFIASGYGVARGRSLERIRNLDVAPTIAALLGVPLPTARGTAIPLR